MKHRVFIAINLSDDIKEKLIGLQKKINDLFNSFYDYDGDRGVGPKFFRWTKKENLHITLLFLGYLGDEEILNVLDVVKKIASEKEPFLINLKKIIYGPQNKPTRMIWIQGEKNKALGKLQEELAEKIQGKRIEKQKNYSPHITLARIGQWEFKKINLEERPEISEEISLSFEVNSIDIMESRLKKSGPGYIILKTCELKI